MAQKDLFLMDMELKEEVRFFEKFANFSIKDFLRTVVSVVDKIKDYFSVLEQL